MPHAKGFGGLYRKLCSGKSREWAAFVLRSYPYALGMSRAHISERVGHCDPDGAEAVARLIYSRLSREGTDLPGFYPTSPEDIWTLLAPIVEETALNYVRVRYYPHTNLSEIFEMMGVSLGDSKESVDLHDDLLTPGQKAVLRMIYGEGLAPEQAAAALGLPKETIRDTLMEAMDSLRPEYLCTGMSERVH